MLPVAVDAMGGDNAPAAILAGAHDAVAAGIPVVLVGPEGLDGVGDIPLLHASEVIEMDEDPAGSVRRKKDSTLVRCAEAVRDGKASAMISAGNTGATMASALLRMGRIKGVARPAIATAVPVPGSTPTVLLDSGANAEVSVEWLAQFAIMGSVYSRQRFGIENPRVGLLSIGEEPGKGDTLRKEGFELLSRTKGINFIGNIEGRDIPKGTARIIVTDGFTGNVALKLYEGTAAMIFHEIKRGLTSSFRGKVAGALGMSVFKDLRKNIDPEEYGSAYLLGVRGISMIGHGNTGTRGMANGILRAAQGVREDVTGHIQAGLTAAP